MRKKLMFAIVAVALTGLAQKSDARPMPTGPAYCTPASYCFQQWHCGQLPNGQYLGVCINTYCLCY